MSQGFTKGVPVDIDPTLSASSNLLVPSQYAVVQYVAAQLATIPSGAVSSVSGTGTVAGISLSGTVTSSGNLTLSGTLSTPVNTINDSTTVGQNLVKLTNPSAVRFLRVNADNTVSALDDATFRTAIGAGTGTVTSVAALTLGTTGTDLSSTVANGTTTPVITLNVPTASATNRGALSSTDWSTFNSKADIAVARIQSTFSNRVSGRYYGQDTNAAAATNIALATGTVYYTPIKVSGASLSIDQLAFNVAVTGTATEFRMAIYRDSGTSWLPDTVWVQTVSTAFSGTGVKTASVSVNLSDSYNWFLAIQVNGSVTVTNINVAAALTPWGTSAVGTVNSTYLSNSMTYGSFLNNPSTSFVQGGPPRLMMRTL